MLKLYNTYTKKVEIFKPLKEGKVKMYNCGPTVYDYVHIGNFRTYLMADFLRRTLEYIGYKVEQVKNITDVGHLTEDDIEAGEDKIIRAARKEKKSPYDIARFYEEAFHRDEKKLNILPAHKFPRATEYIDRMIGMITTLIRNGYAYESNGSVFYDVEKFKDYGRLSGNTLENLKTGARLEVHPDKKHPYDFALWLKADPKHLMQWDSPWSRGYPGWHIECSAMSTANLGETIDIHTGGEDNIFPHHEDEIAQSEGATGKKFVNYWVHGRHLLVDGEKMSKSKGNFYKISDIEKKGLNPIAFRYLCLTTHFQSPLNFTWKSLTSSQKALDRLYDFMRFPRSRGGSTSSAKLNFYKGEFRDALENNLDTSRALSIVWEMIHSREISYTDKKAALLEFDKVLGLGLNKIEKERIEIPQEVEKLVEEREKARKNKDWNFADKLREEIEERGFIVEDTKEGTILKSISRR